ncbi:YopX family protein [Paenibacillus polymyxa]|uniref:YopX family protein n=1 Tax=Paenibacillus polymyxa TaxID=1406 RepID=UPI0008AE00A7|nr:YopX family protein [Paenibacillus polymyxa]SEI76867.1 phage uncharacterized protein TIGR01671 [Paenibacillus polymyxa]
MSRPIKFRMWDFENREMIDGDSLAFEEYAPITDLLSQKGIMQYTGLKDRNGKEIYEGDIVEELDYSDGAYFPKERQPKKRTVVEYDIGFVYARAAYNLRGRMENDLYNGEVIGNIYETPLEDTP